MRSLYFPLLLLLAAASVSKASCPEDWMEYGTKCYKFVDKIMTWKDAGEACDLVQPGALLASAHDLLLNAFLAETIADYKYVWLGLRRASTNVSWTWTDGSNYDFNNWHCDYPADTGERCLEFCSNGHWCDLRCNDVDERPFICQIDA